MDEEAVTKSTLILGIGNILMGDEGFGVHVARGLKNMVLPGNVTVKEAGVGGLNLLGDLEGMERLVVIDVMMIDHTPGELYLYKPEKGFSEPGKKVVSFHQVGVTELVQIWGLLGHEPELLLLVTRPEKMDWNMELSQPLRAAADKAVKLIAELCQSDFTGLERSQLLCIQ